MLRMRKVCLNSLNNTNILTYTSASASLKGKTASGKVNMEELIGNTDGFADSGYARKCFMENAC